MCTFYLNKAVFKKDMSSSRSAIAMELTARCQVSSTAAYLIENFQRKATNIFLYACSLLLVKKPKEV